MALTKPPRVPANLFPDWIRLRRVPPRPRRVRLRWARESLSYATRLRRPWRRVRGALAEGLDAVAETTDTLGQGIVQSGDGAGGCCRHALGRFGRCGHAGVRRGALEPARGIAGRCPRERSRCARYRRHVAPCGGIWRRGRMGGCCRGSAGGARSSGRPRWRRWRDGGAYRRACRNRCAHGRAHGSPARTCPRCHSR